MSFTELGLGKPLLRAIDEQGYQKPTPIQSQVIPALLKGRDLLASAETGSGKSGAFLLPLLQRLASGKAAPSNCVRALVLVPTRELAQQLADAASGYSRYLPLTSLAVYGGVKINPQMMKLRSGIDLLIATPGRLLDLHNHNAVRFDRLETLVLDEADRMLDLGFRDEIDRLLALLPRRRQNLLLSATLSKTIRHLARGLLHKPLEVDTSPRRPTARKVRQSVYEVDKGRKAALVSHLIRDNDWEQVLIFVRTKNGADKLVTRLARDGIEAAAIHGDKSQGARERALADFKERRIGALVATDLASRGIDIDGLPHVINVDLPKVAEEYVHRIGRTGRAGRTGEALSLVSADEVKLLAAIEDLIRQTLVREQEPGFVPSHNVPLTRLTPGGPKPKRPKKPKKPKQPQAVSGTSRKGSPAERGNSGTAAKPKRPRPAKPGRDRGKGSTAPGRRGRRR